jgi:hypothetical protein
MVSINRYVYGLILHFNFKNFAERLVFLSWMELGLGNFLWLCLFGILIVISIQSPILEMTEQNLADHMVIEHTIFFFLRAASVRTAKISPRMLVSYAYNARRNHNPITRPKRNRNSVEHVHSGPNGFHGNDNNYFLVKRTSRWS